jgi:hypothetical protein
MECSNPNERRIRLAEQAIPDEPDTFRHFTEGVRLHYGQLLPIFIAAVSFLVESGCPAGNGFARGERLVCSMCQSNL